MHAQSTALPAVVLATLNAKYIHASLGLRYLLANLGELRETTALREFTIVRPVDEIVEELLDTLDTLCEREAGAPRSYRCCISSRKRSRSNDQAVLSSALRQNSQRKGQPRDAST